MNIRIQYGKNKTEHEPSVSVKSVSYTHLDVYKRQSYNGTVNWKKVKDHNINHAMIKIGSGMNEKRAGRKDSKFDTNFRNAGYASIHRGVYYYSYAKTTSDEMCIRDRQ